MSHCPGHELVQGKQGSIPIQEKKSPLCVCIAFFSAQWLMENQKPQWEKVLESCILFPLNINTLVRQMDFSSPLCSTTVVSRGCSPLNLGTNHKVSKNLSPEFPLLSVLACWAMTTCVFIFSWCEMLFGVICLRCYSCKTTLHFGSSEWGQVLRFTVLYWYPRSVCAEYYVLVRLLWK